MAGKLINDSMVAPMRNPKQDASRGVVIPETTCRVMTSLPPKLKAPTAASRNPNLLVMAAWLPSREPPMITKTNPSTNDRGAEGHQQSGPLAKEGDCQSHGEQWAQRVDGGCPGCTNHGDGSVVEQTPQGVAHHCEGEEPCEGDGWQVPQLGKIEYEGQGSRDRCTGAHGKGSSDW